MTAHRNVSIGLAAALLLGIVNIDAGAQTLKTATNLTAPTLAITATALAAPNPGPSPLASVAVSWAAHANATGYRVLRQGSSFVNGSWVYAPYVSVSRFVLSATTTRTTVTGLPPGVPLHFRVVSILGTGGSDTSAAVSVTTPAVSIPTDTVPPSPLYGSNGFADVVKRACNVALYSVSVDWSHNAAAARYRVFVAPNDSRTNGITAITSDTQTVWQGVMNARPYLYVRPEFSLRDWPGPGQLSYQPGNWAYLGVGVSTSGSLGGACG